MEEASGSSIAAGSRSGVSRCETKRGSGTASFYRAARGGREVCAEERKLSRRVIAEGREERA